MDRSGYDAVWLAEHHFTTYSVCPSVHLMALAAAQRTERLRIGTAVSLAALYHPLRLAEELALLDVLIGGRLNWGAGRGFEPAEFDAFGVPLDETAPRFREAVEVVLEAWTSERLTFHGKFWDFDEVEVLPKPMQRPHPPTWVAATSPEAIGWAAAGGYSILMDPHATFSEIGAKYDRYVADLAANGFPAPDDTPMARLVAVADTDEEAERVARAGAAWTLGAYGHGVPGEVGTRPPRRRRRADRALRPRVHRVGLAGARARRAGPPDRGDAPAPPDDRPAVARVVRPLHRRRAPARLTGSSWRCCTALLHPRSDLSGWRPSMWPSTAVPPDCG